MSLQPTVGPGSVAFVFAARRGERVIPIDSAAWEGRGGRVIPIDSAGPTHYTVMKPVYQ